jgi:hypothetical protein
MISRSGPALIKLMAAPVPLAPAPTRPALSFLPLGAPFKTGGRPNALLSGFLLQDVNKAPAPANPIPARAVFPMNIRLLMFCIFILLKLSFIGK